MTACLKLGQSYDATNELNMHLSVSNFNTASLNTGLNGEHLERVAKHKELTSKLKDIKSFIAARQHAHWQNPATNARTVELLLVCNGGEHCNVMGR